MFLHAILMWPVAARLARTWPWRWRLGVGPPLRAGARVARRRRARAVCMAGRPCAALTQTILRATRKVKRNSDRKRTD